MGDGIAEFSRGGRTEGGISVLLGRGDGNVSGPGTRFGGGRLPYWCGDGRL